MEKRKKWQRYLILIVIALTIYNILPTVFFYSKPLKSSIDAERSEKIAEQMLNRVNALESQSEEWLRSFCSLIHVKPQTVTIHPEQPQLITATFTSIEDANTFRTHLPRAGSLVPFVPAQLSLYDSSQIASKTVVIERKIPIHFDTKQLGNYTQYAKKFDEKNAPTPLYRALVEDRAMQLGMALAGPSENALRVQALTNSRDAKQSQEICTQLAEEIISFTKVYPEEATVTKRYFSSFTQIDLKERSAMVQTLIHSMETARESIQVEIAKIKKQSDELKHTGGALAITDAQRLDLLSSREHTLALASAVVKRNAQVFAAGKTPLTFSAFASLLQSPSYQPLQIVSLEGRNPFIDAITIDWNNEKINLVLNPSIATLRDKLDQQPGGSHLRDWADQLLYNQIAFVSRQAGEEITPNKNQFEIALSALTHSNSFLALRLSSIAGAQAIQLQEALKTTWQPMHPDLAPSAFPIYDETSFSALDPAEQQFGLVIYAPALSKKAPPQGFQMNAVYVIAKGMDKLVQRFKNEGRSELSEQFMQDFNALRTILQRNGFVGYSGNAYDLGPEFASDFIFENRDYYHMVLKATREDFAVHGTKRYAILEYTDVEQRILAENKIDNSIHEDLLKWRDDYYAAKLGIRGVSKYDVPKPTQNVFWNNFKLSCVKYFRGDDRKILHWGLDLSGGKTVHIQLRDSNNRIVTNEADIKQGINELQHRVNKMGVSEVTIRKEGNFITLDFPGSQGLSAAELIKASSMYFHIVNEKFGPNNPTLSAATNQFLQDVWNEAVVTNRKDSDAIHQIAYKQLYGGSIDPDTVKPRSESARILYENGLRLSNPAEATTSNIFNETLSKIALFRGDDFTQWQGQTHPLVVVFHNFALEGSNLENVQASYDPSKGNYLAFSVRGSYTNKEGEKVTPRDALFAWTSQFAKEKISGTPAEILSNGKGWRMAVILNGSIISAPTLDSALRDSAMISGSFTQREITKLEADLKAGSLSFTPHILSEKNVSPELGASERVRGIVATILSLILVMGAMIGYYRFAGLVASTALFFNLFLMWATLQNLQAAMTLAGIAGIILTLGMAVDANVLVFERIREEFDLSGRIAPAVHAGYRKAFSAILDSNVTTIIAAMILLQFDSGPIKAFAIMLIIGILSSMFTALFATRFFFAGWVQNQAHKKLHMLNWFKAKSYNFLKHTKKAVVFSAAVILLGAFAFIAKQHTIFGMDFSGGYALNVELQATPNADYRRSVEEALLKQGAHSQDFQVRELTPSNHVRIFLSKALQQPGRPFFGMPIENPLKEPVYQYQLNPKIVWVVNALEQSHLTINPSSLQHLDTHWTQVSGQMSDTMAKNAIIGLSLAMLCILIYITIRFEFKYAISATLCTVHDVVFTIAVLGLLHALGVSIQIDLNTVAALMTIVGYSLNDTIIVFDRIREDVRLMRKSSLTEIINHALNVTLSRTIMTSGTTLLVLIPLIFLGGSTLFGFSLVMAVGVIFGTLSSLFIAAPMMKYFHDREAKKEEKWVLDQK